MANLKRRIQTQNIVHQSVDVSDQIRANTLQSVAGMANKMGAQDEAKVAQITRTYRVRNNQLGQNVVKQAYEANPTDPTAFAKTAKQGLDAIYKGLDSDEDKISFMADMQVYTSPYSSRVNVNYDNKMELIANTARRDGTNLAVSNFGENASMLYTKTKGYTDLLIPLKQAYDHAEDRDESGNYILSVGERARARDAWENKGFYGIIGWAGEMQQRKNYNELTKTRNYALKNKNKFMKENELSEETYTKTLKALDHYIKGGNGSGGNSPASSAKLITLKAMIKDMDISNGTIKNEQYRNLTDINEVKAGLTSAYESGDIKYADYISNMVTCKEASVKLLRDRAEVKEKAGTVGVWGHIGNFVTFGLAGIKDDPKSLEQTALEGTRAMLNPLYELDKDNAIYLEDDILEGIYRGFDEAGLDPKNTDSAYVVENLEKINSIRNNVVRQIYPNARKYTDEALNEPDMLQTIISAGHRDFTMDVAQTQMDKILNPQTDLFPADGKDPLGFNL